MSKQINKGDLQLFASLLPSSEAISSFGASSHRKQIDRPELERRLAYLLQIERQRLSALENSKPCHQSKSCQPQPLEQERRELLPKRRLPSGHSSRQATVKPGSVNQVSRHKLQSHGGMLSFLMGLAWKYVRTICLILATLFCLDLAVVLTFGNIRKLPGSYLHMAQRIHQGFHCGWSVPVPDDWRKCD